MPRAMILAAGLGTRLRPLTDVVPKALVEVNGRPLIDHVIERLRLSGFDEVIVNLHHKAEMLRQYLQSSLKFPGQITFSDETELLLDSGGAIRHARWFLDRGESFMVHNCDVLSRIPLDKLYAQHVQSGALATVAVSRRQTSRPLAFDWERKLLGRYTPEIIDQKQEVTSFAFSGVYALSPHIFDYMPPAQTFSIVDVLVAACASSKILAYEHPAADWIDAGKPESLKKASDFH